MSITWQYPVFDFAETRGGRMGDDRLDWTSGLDPVELHAIASVDQRAPRSAPRNAAQLVDPGGAKQLATCAAFEIDQRQPCERRVADGISDARHISGTFAVGGDRDRPQPGHSELVGERPASRCLSMNRGPQGGRSIGLSDHGDGRRGKQKSER
ncbi:hypothetical protein EEB18_012075 [Sphingopyxis sp. OPL5]|uniref:hypothetical protein n=1 Tax=Sphingopyxis sp. OPL5 TaxID=2486273 RepID=UPI0016575F0E|nr:hypothetical protein [Sphingopyxis sp. OPL5]QNO25544.1 hypothetical protein EEB18_012075 [Sphingopyxis sp. OPL5]